MNEQKKCYKKKKITMNSLQRKYFVVWLIVLICSIGNLLFEVFEMKGTQFANISRTIFVGLEIIFLCKFCYYEANYEVEKEDELAKENMLKADASIIKAILVLFAIALCISFFFEFDFHITNDNLISFGLIIMAGYQTLKSGFFLLHEGKTYADESEEE